MYNYPRGGGGGGASWSRCWLSTHYLHVFTLCSFTFFHSLTWCRRRPATQGRGGGRGGGEGYSGVCLLHGLGLYRIIFFKILNFAVFRGVEVLSTILWLCHIEQVFVWVCHFPQVLYGGVSLKMFILWCFFYIK